MGMIRGYTQILGQVEGMQKSNEGTPNGYSWNKTINKINKVVLDSKSKYKCP